MSGRIRTIKPEWLEDEGLLRAGANARVLSVALLLLADDYGNGRCVAEALGAQVFPFDPDPSAVFREALASLSRMGFLTLYQVRGQNYFSIRTWSKHQKVDKPSKPRVPGPDLAEKTVSREPLSEPPRDTRETLAPDPDPIRPDPTASGALARTSDQSAGMPWGWGQVIQLWNDATGTMHNPSPKNREACERLVATQTEQFIRVAIAEAKLDGWARDKGAGPTHLEQHFASYIAKARKRGATPAAPADAPLDPEAERDKARFVEIKRLLDDVPERDERARLNAELEAIVNRNRARKSKPKGPPN